MYHGEAPAGDFTFQKCQKSFAGKGLLSKYMKHSMCDSMKNYECEYCRKKYKKRILWISTYCSSLERNAICATLF